MRSEPDQAMSQYAVLGILASLVVLTVGAIAFALLADAQTEVEEPRVVVLPMREPEEPPPVVPEDPPPTPAPVAQVRAVGCGKEPPHRKRDTMMMTGRKITVYVPTKYDPAEPRPLVLFFHDDHQTANGFFWDTGFEEVAEAHNILLAFPRDQDLLNWRDPADIDAGADAVAFVDSLLCVDHERIYAVGHGSGGDLVERLPCEIGLRAMATTGHRSGPRIACSDVKTPYLHVANLRDGYLPPDGDGCQGPVPTLTSHEAAWRDKNACDDRRKSYFRRGPHQCWTYSCDTTFVTCHLEAGRGWPQQDKARALDILNCDGAPPSDFPLAEVVWRFFASHVP